MRFGWNPKQAFLRFNLTVLLGALGLIALYAIIYFAEPFSPFVNNLTANLLSVVAALSGAIFAIRVWAKYEKTDAPRRIWGNFAIGLWLWAIGDAIWGTLNLVLPGGEVPNSALNNVFWMSAYFFIGRALISQYQILVQPTRRELTNRILASVLFWCSALVLIFIALKLFSDSPDAFDTTVNAFYPASDLTLGLAALWLARNFRGGALGRPWIGFLVFALSDLMNAWLQLSGTYAWSLEQGNLLSGISDIIYFSAYLALGFGAFSQWAFLKYGLRTPVETR
jgi:hypothetical protein